MPPPPPDDRTAPGTARRAREAARHVQNTARHARDTARHAQNMARHAREAARRALGSAPARRATARYALRLLGRVWADLTRSAAGRRFAMLVILVCCLMVGALVFSPDRQSLIRIWSRVQAGAAGDLAPVFAVVGSAVLAAAVVPRTLLSLVGGVLFGWLPGATYVLVGVTLGAVVAFGVGRLLGRRFVAERLRGWTAEAERAVARQGAVAVAVARLIPLVPFGVANYAFGTSRVRISAFVIGTLVGAAPATIAYAALGAATARGDATGMAVAGVCVVVLGAAGTCGTYLVWRFRPASRATLVRGSHPASPATLVTQSTPARRSVTPGESGQPKGRTDG
jgi:uncharacterized membrane protein YdjX (TVP38/TMEM64 family)